MQVVEGLLAMMDMYKYMLLLMEKHQTGVMASHKSVKVGAVLYSSSCMFVDT